MTPPSGASTKPVTARQAQKPGKIRLARRQMYVPKPLRSRLPAMRKPDRAKNPLTPIVPKRSMALAP